MYFVDFRNNINTSLLSVLLKHRHPARSHSLVGIQGGSALTALFPLKYVTCFAHVKTRAIALPQMIIKTILAHVHLVSTALGVNSIIDLVPQILVGTTVNIFFVLLLFSSGITLGICNGTSDGKFNCTCAPGWEGRHCERMTNYCYNITCENKGVCRPSLGKFSCECLDGYSGQYCGTTATRLVIIKAVSKSFAFVAILAMASVVTFVIVMDILKYCFGIDLVEEERERMRREKRAKKRRLVIQRFAHVNAPAIRATFKHSMSTLIVRTI